MDKCQKQVFLSWDEMSDLTVLDHNRPWRCPEPTPQLNGMLLLLYQPAAMCCVNTPPELCSDIDHAAVIIFYGFSKKKYSQRGPERFKAAFKALKMCK